MENINHDTRIIQHDRAESKGIKIRKRYNEKYKAPSREADSHPSSGSKQNDFSNVGSKAIADRSYPFVRKGSIPI
jgi:hypothetical protein